LFFITRPIVLVSVWGFSLFGYRLSSKTSDIFQEIGIVAVLQILFFSLSVASVYVFNQIADRKVDAENGGFPLLLKTGICDKIAWIWAVILAVFSIAIPFLCGYKTICLLSLASIMLGIVYCFKPFSFSGRPILDFLSNALGYGTIAFSVGWVLGGKNFNVGVNCEFLNAMFPYFWMMAGGSISSTLPDYDGDRLSGKNTTAVCFGKRVAHYIAIFCIISSVTSAYYSKDFIAIFASGCAFPFYILYATRWQSQKLMEACYKVGGAISMLIIGLFFPILIIMGAIILAASVLYFRVFYKVLYPSLLPVYE
jgi:4-hydroxybenzoate polyprenyltransferase